MAAATIAIEGHCHPDFARVREAFATNFTERSEVGASVALVREGELVVDLWGGHTDAERSRPWQADTLVNIWSTTKGVTAIVVALLVERGLLDYDAPVARYWPEFAAAGKAEVTVAMLMSHQAGLCGFRETATLDLLYDQPRAARTLAAMEPLWVPGTNGGYHAITVGILADELCRRTDGRDLASFVHEEFAFADLSIGLPPDRTVRAGTMLAPPTMSTDDLVSGLTPIQLAALLNPPLQPTFPNTEDWRMASLPSANGFGTARGLAELYARFISGALVKPEVVAAATQVRWSGTDAVLSHEARWAAGFLRNVAGLYGPNERAFGHSGWGGAFAFADPDRRITFAYTMNRMGTDLVGDPRNMALVQAHYR